MKNPAEFQEDKKSLSHTINDVLDKISFISNEVNELIKLQFNLGILELKESGKKLALDSVLIIAGALIGLVSMLVFTILLIMLLGNILPLNTPWNYTVSAGLIFLLYSGASAFLILNGIKKLKSKSLVPEASITEIKNDKEWIKGLNQ